MSDMDGRRMPNESEKAILREMMATPEGRRWLSPEGYRVTHLEEAMAYRPLPHCTCATCIAYREMREARSRANTAYARLGLLLLSVVCLLASAAVLITAY